MSGHAGAAQTGLHECLRDLPRRMRGVRTGHLGRMIVYVVWTSADLHRLDPSQDLVGPWREVVVAARGLAFVESDDTVSRVYHAMKWALPEGVALAVAPIADLPKAKGLESGTNSWLRTRLR